MRLTEMSVFVSASIRSFHRAFPVSRREFCLMSTDQIADSVDPGDDRRIGAEVWSVVAVLILGTFMVILDTTIVNIAIDPLSRDLHARLADIQWVVTGYLLSIAVVAPLTGWAARRLGPKRLYLISMAVF